MTTLIPKHEQPGSTINRSIAEKLNQLPNQGDFADFAAMETYAKTLTSPSDMAVKPGDSVRTLTSKLEEILSVLDFGADPTGVADSTTAFQAAIDATTATKGCIYIPRGSYKITTTINIEDKFGLSIIGSGQGSVINFTSTTADCFHIKGTSTGTVFNNFWLVGSATASAGNLINVDVDTNPALFLNNLIINRGWNAIVTQTQVAGTVFLQNFLFSNQNNIGIVSKGGFWADTGNINNAAAAGVYITNGLGPFMSNVDLFECAVGVAMLPAAGVTVGQSRFDNVAAENGTTGWVFGSSGGGDVVSVFMNNCNATGNSARGVYIGDGVDGLDITGIQASGNGGDGITIFDGLNVYISGGIIAGNTGSGIGINSNVNNFEIIGVRAGNAAQYGGNGANGITVNAGTSNNYIISLNRVSGNTGSGVSDAGTGVNKYVANNI